MKSFLRTRLPSKVISVAALLSAFAVEWMLVNVPVSEVSGQFPATVRARDEVVTFAAPAAVTGDSFLVEYAQPSESEKVLLDAFFDNAQLSDATIATLKSLQVSAPSKPGLISHQTSNVGSGSCATKLRVEPASGPFASIEFSQNGDDVSSDYRELGIRFTGADGLVTLTPQGAFQDGVSPCKVGLSIDDWKQSTAGFLPIQVRVSAGQPFRFHWRNLTERTTTWKTKSSAIALVTFGSANDQFLSDGIAIRSVNPKTGKPDNPPSLEARGQRHTPLTVSFFGINQSQLEISASGKGRALRHGSVIRQNVLETLITKYPIPAALLAAGNLALIAWVKRAFLPSRSQADRTN